MFFTKTLYNNHKDFLMRFRFIYHHKDEFRIAKMAEVLKVTVGGYYSWLKRLYKEDDSPDADIIKNYNC